MACFFFFFFQSVGEFVPRLLEGYVVKLLFFFFKVIRYRIGGIEVSRFVLKLLGERDSLFCTILCHCLPSIELHPTRQ